MKKIFDFGKLSTQLILSFFLVVLLAALLVGLPAIWLLQNQLEAQAWAQVNQGEQTAVSLYEKKHVELQNLAILTAQRPTLKTLVERNDLSTLQEYLFTLQRGADVDLINLCQIQSTITGTVPELPVCRDQSEAGYYLDGENPWMIVRRSIDTPAGQGEVVLGLKLDHEFTGEIQDQIGLEHALLIQKRPVSTSLSPQDELIPPLRECLLNSEQQFANVYCDLAGTPYYTTSFPLDENGLNGVVALDISQITIAKTRLILWMSIAMAGVALVGSVLGVFLSRRISRPLVKVSTAAASFSRGDLETPVLTESRVQEINQVAVALDRARIDLLGTLRSLEDERDWSKNLLSSIVEGILTLDADNQITFFSQGAERLTGLLKTDVVGRSIDEIFRLAETNKPFSSTIFTTTGSYQNVDLQLSDQSIVSYAITMAKLTRSGENGFETALVFRDISEEEVLHRLLGRFIASVAHELRTPLTALEASIELLMDQSDELKLEERRELYNSLHLGIINLHTLVDNFLESANIEAHRFRISPRGSDLSKIIGDAVNTMQPLLLKYDQKLTVEIPMDFPKVHADMRRIVQVLVNLISNANKYSPPGDEINLEVTSTTRFARMAVKDRGPGIPPEHHDNLFRRFVFPQTKNEISQAGAGLGLSVVKAIVEAHGGEVGVEDRPGGGSIFWFTLPLASEEI
ncbi:MAG: HAMP domain-containing protein [Anaerolineales bacterium]|nr:MAG: HAMP domain-containing protein [Anaerolineales bacterium]